MSKRDDKSVPEDLKPIKMSKRISMKNGITINPKKPSMKIAITRGQSMPQDARMSDKNSTSRKISFRED